MPTITKSTRSHGANEQRSGGGNENENEKEHENDHDHDQKIKIEIKIKTVNECAPRQRTRKSEGW